MGNNLAAACEHDEASVAEQAGALCEACNLLKASVCAGVSCARSGRFHKAANANPNERCRIERVK